MVSFQALRNISQFMKCSMLNSKPEIPQTIYYISSTSTQTFVSYRFVYLHLHSKTGQYFYPQLPMPPHPQTHMHTFFFHYLMCFQMSMRFAIKMHKKPWCGTMISKVCDILSIIFAKPYGYSSHFYNLAHN